MARKRYQIDFVIDSARAEAAGRRVVRMLENAEAAAKRAGTAMENAYNRAATAANNAASAMASAASRMPAGGGPGGGGGSAGGGRSSGGSIQSIEDRYFKAEYDRRAKYEARKQQLAAAAAAKAASQAEKQANQLAAIEDRYAKADYERRTKLEAKKQQQALSEAARLSGIEDRYTKRDYDQKVKYEAKKQQQAAAEAAKTASRAESQAAQLSAIEDRYAQRDYARRVANERRQIAQKERENRQLASIEDRYLRDEYRRRVAYQARQAKEQEKEAERAAAQRQRLLQQGIAAAATVAAAGLNFLTTSYAKIAEDAERAAAATIEMRQKLRIESTLKGAEGPTNQMLREALKLRAATGLNESDASALTQQYLGTIPIALQKKNIAPGVANDLMTQVGIRAARQGGDTGTHGELAGILGQFGKVDSVAAGLGQLEAIRVALTEGRGDDPILTRQLLASAGSMVREGGAVGSLSEQAALIGVTSLSGGPAKAGTRAEQLSRGLRAGLTKMRGGPGTVEPQGKWLKRLGVTENDSLEVALDKIIPDLRKAKAEGRGLEVFLSEHGMKSEEERRALIEVEGVYEQLKERFAAARKASTQGGPEALAANQRFLESDLGRSQVAEQLGAVSTATRGMRGARLSALTQEAKSSPEFQRGEQSLTQQGLDQFWGMLSGNFTLPLLGTQFGSGDAGEAGRQQRLQMSAIRLAEERAKRAGVTLPEMAKARAASYRAGGEFQAEYVNQLESATMARGGRVGVDTAPALAALTAAVEENNRLLRDNNQRLGPPQPIAPQAPRALGPRP